MRTLCGLLLLFWLPGTALCQQIVAGGPVSPDGKECVQIDYPHQQCDKNVGGTDGAGLCVFTSIQYAARWQNEEGLLHFQKDMRKERGGGWPEKVDKMIAKYGRRGDGQPVQYLQYEGKDLAVLKAALQSGRMPAVTYSGRDGVFYRSPIAHMVCIVHCSDRWVALRDNNFVGENQILWMSPQQFLERYSGWCVILLRPGPPPVPTLDEQDTQPLPRPVTLTAGFDEPEPFRTYSWRPVRPGWLALWRGPEQVGCWHETRNTFRSYDGASWGRPCARPIPVEEVKDYGVAVERMAGCERFVLNGREVPRTLALSEVCGRNLPDDAGKLRVTITGPGARELALAFQTSAELLPWRGKVVLQEYPEGSAHWHLAGLGFPDKGVVVQSPAGGSGRGLVLHASDSHDPAALAQALRKADPKFDPKKSPNLNNQLPGLPPIPLAVPAAAAGATALILYRRRKAS